MDTEVMDDLGQDAAAVAAVRAGDAERYRELVERHERQVYAVAWSRLGDAELAEEAAQEAFIKGYRRLWLLGDGAKFAGWIAAIARNAAINLGMRHRRELQKRQRWALEQPSAATGSAEETENSPSPEVLRESLMELPAAHRECLVVFYLEGKSGEEAALALGISESAFRVRLHRAKAALRERLEDKLADSLASLRPKKSLVPAVMLSVLATSSAQAAVTGGVFGLGAKVISSVGKSVLPSLLAPLMPLLGLLPGLLLAWKSHQLERENFRDSDGFRSRLHDQFSHSFLWGFPLLLLLSIVFNRIGAAQWGMQTTLGLLALFFLIPTIQGLRLLTINRSQFYIVSLIGACAIHAVFVAVALGVLPLTGVFLSVIFSSLISLFVGHRPLRMDYNLFLRAAQKLFPSSTKLQRLPVTALRREELRDFARFLGSRWLASDFRWEKAGLRLFLPPVKSSFLGNMIRSFLPMRMGASSILLNHDGMVSARMGTGDARTLYAMEAGRAGSIAELEEQVESAVERSWQHFRAGNVDLAQRVLGEVADEEVFLVPPAHSKGMRWQRAVLVLCLAVFVGLSFALHQRPLWFENLKPVTLSETQVRTALARFVEQGEKTSTGDGVAYALMNCFTLPSRELFDEQTVSILKHQLMKSADFDPDGLGDEKVGRLQHAWLLGRGVAAGWLTLEELKVTSAQMRSYLGAQKLPHQKFIFTQRSVNDRTVAQLDSRQLAQLRSWQRLDCLDLVEREKLIQQMASWQVSHGEAYADRPPMSDWRQARGLFATAGWPAIQDTYFVMAGLEILGGLDKIDREACIQGILRLHQGRGFFSANRTQVRGNFRVRGDAKDTFCAFETLRILGALDRIDDLEEWQFRVRSNRKTEEVTWDEIEAWVCQQRFERMLRERKANPQAPVRSLLEP